jgi:hypothetical protein
MAVAITTSAEEPKNLLGHRGAKAINDAWKGDFIADATTAAFQYGLLVGASMLPYDRALILLETHFKHRKVDVSHWSSVYESFLCGRNSGVTHAELRERMEPVAANDNTKDDTIDAETLLGMDFEPLEYVIPGYVVEGLTVLGGKPKLGKSWWAYDASIAVATGGKAMGSVDCE